MIDTMDNRALGRLAAALTCALGVASTAGAQPRPSTKIGPFVVDLRAAIPSFPSNVQLATSRGVGSGDLPGAGLGIDVGAHLYLVRWRAITFGIGGELLTARARSSPPDGQAITERYTSVAPQLSFNFGSAKGWSYLSGGIGPSVWSIVPNGSQPMAADKERLKTINYGGGARWFSKKHLAFTFDVRFYAINPGTPTFGFPGAPRTRLLVIGAGVSVR
jgi:hypothetical protein